MFHQVANLLVQLAGGCSASVTLPRTDWSVSFKSGKRRRGSSSICSWHTFGKSCLIFFPSLTINRDQQRLGLVPKRVIQLVKSYPYSKQVATEDQHYLPRPKFSTQNRPVLYIRVAVPPTAKNQYSGRPIQLLRDSITAQVDDASAGSEYHTLWADLQRSAQAGGGQTLVPDNAQTPTVFVTGLLTEGTLSMLSSTSGESTAPTSSRPTDSEPVTPLYRLLSPGRRTNGTVSVNPTAPTSPIEWDEFTGAGFGPISEGTVIAFSDFGPPSSPRQMSATVGANLRSTKASRSTRRRSIEFKQPLSAAPLSPTDSHAADAPKEFPTKDASAVVNESIEGALSLDEALIDGWAEVILDRTVASAWPSFVLYELRNPLTAPSSTEGGEEARIRWLSIETYVLTPPAEPEQSVPSSPVRATAGNKVKRSSSVKSDKRARFGFFSSQTSLNAKDGKDDKKEKRKEHNRRGSGMSLESATKAMGMWFLSKVPSAHAAHRSF